MVIKCRLSVILLLVKVISTCPTGFSISNSNKNICYKIFHDNATWHGSIARCQQHHSEATLLSVTSKDDFLSLLPAIRENKIDIWTSLIIFPASKSWADGTPHNSELDHFISNNTDTGVYSYISAVDGLFHTSNSTVHRGRICYLNMTSPERTTFTNAVNPPSFCELPWFRYADICYWLSEEPENWRSSANKCIAMGAEFVSIHQSEVLTVLLLREDQKTFWTGLMDQNGTYTYDDGSSTDDVEDIIGPYIDKWEKDSDCLALDPNRFPLVFSHRSCSTQLRYICYKPASMSPP